MLFNRTKGCRNGDSDVYKTFTDSYGELYRAMMREYGRCTGKVYIDTKTGARAIGWVFMKRQTYDDCNETYILETWVTVHKAPPTKTTEFHYANC